MSGRLMRQTRVPVRWYEWPLAVPARLFDRFKIANGSGKRPTRPHAPERCELADLLRPEYLRDPGLFYDVASPVRDVRVLSRERLDGPFEAETIRFRSNFPLGPACNRTGYAVHTRLPAPRVPIASMIILPGWGRSHLAVEKRWALHFARAGIETLLVVLPFHMQRCPEGFWSGECMISGDVVRTARAFQQTVAEVRGLVPMLQRRTPRVGIFGVSLGGILAHLAMTVHRFDFGVSMIAGGQAAGITWNGILTTYVRRDIQRAGIDLALLDRLWAAASPTRIARHNRTWPILMIAGKFDQVVPSRYAAELWEALGRPAIRWYPCAHYSAVFFLRSMLEEICRFVHEVCAAGPKA